MRLMKAMFLKANLKLSDVLKTLFTVALSVFALAPSLLAAEAAPVAINPLTAQAKFLPSRIPVGGTTHLTIDMKLSGEYKAYVDRFKLSIEGPQDLKLDAFKVSPTEKFYDKFSKSEREGVKKEGQMKALVEVPVGFLPGQYKAQVKLTYQACTKEHCLFPKSLMLEAPFEVFVDSAAAAAATTSSTSPPPPSSSTAMASSDSTDFQKALGQGTLSALAFVFFIGFLTSLTPCIYPMIPITLAVLGARTKGQTKLKSFSLSIVYVLGIALTYSVLGVTAATTGSLFGSALSNVWVVSAIALLFVAMGLSMYGLFEVQAPAMIRDRLGTAQSGSGYSGAFITGLIAGVVASPCIGPVLVSVLAYIAQTQNQVLGFMLLFSFAMGMGVLFIVLGTSSSLISRVPKAGPWMEIVKFAFGTVMVAMALYYIQPLYPKWLFHFLVGAALILVASAYGAFEANASLTASGRVRKGTMLASFVIGLVFALTAVVEKFGITTIGSGFVAESGQGSNKADFGKLDWKPYTESAVEEAVSQSKPILVDFYADWCGACKELEKFTFTDPRVRELSKQFVLLKIDATEDFPELENLKKKYSVLGLPTLILYDAKGKVRSDLTVTGFEEADAFLKRMHSALPSSSISQRDPVEGE